MTALAASVIVCAIAMPHFLRLERASPPVAVTLWMSALALRALMAVFTALFVLLYLPGSELFGLLSHLCWHTVLPFLATHLGLSGHGVGDAALLAPSFALAASVLSMLIGVGRAARRVRKLLVRHSIGAGPANSVILGDGGILVAAAGLRRPRVVVSAGALVAFDDEELAASLDHERGHIARRHRYVLISAELCRALARFVPGTRTTHRELRFHLERDADRYATRRRHEPAVLASAICKVAEAELLIASAMGLAGGGVERRVQALLDGRAPVTKQLRLRAIAVAMVALVAVGASALPAAAHAGYHQAQRSAPLQCER